MDSGETVTREDLRASEDRLDQKIEEVKSRLGELAGNLDQVAGNLDQVAGNLDQVAGNLDQVAGNLHAEMRELRHDLGTGINAVLERITDMIGVVDEKYRHLPSRVDRLEEHLHGHCADPAAHPSPE